MLKSMPPKFLSRKRFIFFLFLLFLIIASLFYFIFLKEYLATRLLLLELSDKKETLQKDIEKLSSLTEEAQTTSSYAEISSLILSFNETFLHEAQTSIDVQQFLEEHESLLQNNAINLSREYASLDVQTAQTENLSALFNIQYTLLSHIYAIDERTFNVSILEQQISQYPETQESQKTLHALYLQKLTLLSEKQKYLVVLNTSLSQFDIQEPFSSQTYFSAFSQETEGIWSIYLSRDALLKWTENSFDLLSLEIEKTQEEINALASPLYDVVIEPIYQEEFMFGFLDQMESFKNPPLSFSVTNKRDTPITLLFSAEIEGYTSETKKMVTISARNSRTVELYLSSLPNTDLTEMRSANLHYTVSAADQDTVALEDSVSVSLYPKNVMIWNNNFNVSNYLIAGFVTPHAPVIKELLRHAAEFVPGGTLSTFCDWCSSSDDWRIQMQLNVKAIYNAMKFDYDITYVNTPIAYGTSDNQVYQTVYLPSQSLTYSSANCIDGTVTFASALEAIGMDAYIILIPEHSFVCYDLTPQDDYNHIEQCLETTVINDYGPNDAIEIGNDEIDRYWDYSSIVSIKKAREMGILPIE